MINYT